MKIKYPQGQQQEGGDKDGNEIKEQSDNHRNEIISQKQPHFLSKKQQSFQNSIEMKDELENHQNRNSLTLKIAKIKLPELPKANEILPKSTSRKEQPNYVIGKQYITINELDGNHPEEERLWTQKEEDADKLLFEQRGRYNNKQNNESVLRRKSYATSPQSSSQQPIHISNCLKELSSLIKEYSVVYSKYPEDMYSSFNVVQCDLKKIQETINFKQDYMTNDVQPIQKLDNHANKKDDGQFSSDNKTVSYFLSDPSALDQLQQNLQDKNQYNNLQGALQFTKSCQYESKQSRKHADNISLDKRIKKHSQDDSIIENSENKNMNTNSQQIVDDITSKNIEIEVTNSSINGSIEVPQSRIQQNKQTIKKQVSTAQYSLGFESKFECGNLSYAFMKSDRQYLLLLQNDINTRGFTQWFYFRVTNDNQKGKITFSILNYQKSYSLFSQGMKVLVYSKKKRESQNLGWHRACQNISYTKNEYRRQSSSSSSQNQNQSYYTLEFTYDFSEEGDEVFFAYNYPYTYSDLQNYLSQIESNKYKRQFINRKIMCRTLAQNRVDLLTITDGSSNYHINKQTIVISARVHPGETVSSFMIKGLIDYLLEDTPDSSYLRNNFIFKIIPMLNPDGVIHGNYRCSLAGKDLNRQWKKPSKGVFAEIHFLKKLILSTKKIVLFCDLHGHSIKKNIFVYGCHDYSQPSACRELPYILSKIYQPFSFKDCNFKIQMEKQGTARVALWKTLRIPNIFTLESSFCGPSYDDIHFKLQDLENMGKALCQAFMIYFEPSSLKQGSLSSRKNSVKLKSTDPLNIGDVEKDIQNQQEEFIQKQQQQLHSVAKLMNLLNINKKDIQNELNQNEELLQMGMNDSDGSDSCPSEDELENIVKCQSNIEEPSKLEKQTPSPIKSSKKLQKKGDSATKTNLINCLPFQRPVAFNSSSNSNQLESVKPQSNIKRLEIACKSNLVLNDDLPQAQHNIMSLSPRNNILTNKLKGKSSMHIKNISNKKDIILGNSVLTHNNNNNHVLTNNLEKSPMRKNIEPIEMQDETVNLKSTLIFKRNPLYDYYESIQPKVRVKASELGNLKRNLENEINNIVKNRRSLTPTKMVPNRLDQLLNHNLNNYNISNNNDNNNNSGNLRNLNSNQSHSNNNRHYSNQSKANYFPSIKNNSKQKSNLPIITQKSNNISIGVQNYQNNNNFNYNINNSQNNSQVYHKQRNYSQQLRLDEEALFIPQNVVNITPVNPSNKSLESSVLIQGQQYNSKSPQRMKNKYQGSQQNNSIISSIPHNYLSTEPSETITLNTYQHQRVDTEAYIIEEINYKHKQLMGRNIPTRSSSMKKKISIPGDSIINNTEILNYQPQSIRQKRHLNKISVISTIQQQQQQNQSNQNQIVKQRQNNDNLRDFMKFGNNQNSLW